MFKHLITISAYTTRIINQDMEMIYERGGGFSWPDLTHAFNISLKPLNGKHGV